MDGFSLAALVLARRFTGTPRRIFISGCSPNSRTRFNTACKKQNLMIDPQYLFIEDVTVLQKHFYRMGGERPQDLFTRTRAFKDLIIYPKDGFDFVRANGNGFSMYDRVTDGMKKPGRIVWRLSATLPLPKGLVLVKDMTPDKQGHYMLAPANDMPLDKYMGLLQETVTDRVRCLQLSSMEVLHA